MKEKIIFVFLVISLCILFVPSAAPLMGLLMFGKGLAVESFGLDLLSGKPEGTILLDGMIDYVRDRLRTDRSMAQ